MADHATKNTTTSNLPGLTGERVKAGVTIVVTLYALVNAGLSLAGINPLPFTNEQVSASDLRCHRHRRNHLRLVEEPEHHQREPCWPAARGCIEERGRGQWHQRSEERGLERRFRRGQDRAEGRHGHRRHHGS